MVYKDSLKSSICCVRGCTNTTRSNSHWFPSKEKLRLKWVEACDNKDLFKLPYSMLIKRQLKICRSHFKPSDYSCIASKRLLKCDILPSLNLPEKGQTIPLETDTNVNEVEIKNHTDPVQLVKVEMMDPYTNQDCINKEIIQEALTGRIEENDIEISEIKIELQDIQDTKPNLSSIQLHCNTEIDGIPSINLQEKVQTSPLRTNMNANVTSICVEDETKNHNHRFQQPVEDKMIKTYHNQLIIETEIEEDASTIGPEENDVEIIHPIEFVDVQNIKPEKLDNDNKSGFQQKWTELYGIVENKKLAVCTLCDPYITIAMNSKNIRQHFLHKHSDILLKKVSEATQHVKRQVFFYNEKIKRAGEKPLKPCINQVVVRNFARIKTKLLKIEKCNKKIIYRHQTLLLKQKRI